MKQRKSQREILGQLVSNGQLTSEQAEEIAQAPSLAITVRELVTYLAAILITIGVAFIVSGLVVDVPQAGIAALLYAVAAGLGYFAHKLASESNDKQRAGEVLETAAVLAIAVASGILLEMVNMRSEWSVCILAFASGTWGVARSSRSQFSGSILMTVSLPIMIMSLTSTMNLSGENNQVVIGLLLVLGGIGLIAVGMKKMGFSFLPRTMGSLLIVIGSITLANAFSLGVGAFIPIAIGAALFTLGTKQLASENLVAGSFGIIVGIIMTVVHWLPGTILQGVAVIACGAALLVVLRAQLARASQSKTETPTA